MTNTPVPTTITRYLAWDKPIDLLTIVKMFEMAAYESAGYEVLHKTIAGAAAKPAMVGAPIDHYVKVTFEDVEVPK